MQEMSLKINDTRSYPIFTKVTKVIKILLTLLGKITISKEFTRCLQKYFSQPRIYK